MYLLRGARGRTYVGFTPDPPRRVRQHNGELAGGDAPKGGRPWELVLVVYGFPSKYTALAFESAWQRPHTSRHTARVWDREGFGPCSGRTTVMVRLAALSLHLVIMPVAELTCDEYRKNNMCWAVFAKIILSELPFMVFATFLFYFRIS